MSNTYHQICLHIVFAVKYRDAMLTDQIRDNLWAYVGGIIRRHNHVALEIGGWHDHMHILVSCDTSLNIPDLVKDIKVATNKWLQPKYKCKFGWQDGYGVFSISPSHLDAVKKYIQHQPQHHQHISMVDDFKRLISVNGLNYDEKYLPHNPI